MNSFKIILSDLPIPLSQKIGYRISDEVMFCNTELYFYII